MNASYSLTVLCVELHSCSMDTLSFFLFSYSFPSFFFSNCFSLCSLFVADVGFETVVSYCLFSFVFITWGFKAVWWVWVVKSYINVERKSCSEVCTRMELSLVNFTWRSVLWWKEALRGIRSLCETPTSQETCTVSRGKGTPTF